MCYKIQVSYKEEGILTLYEFQRIFCIGRNYVKHAEELKNEVPKQPIIFLKPLTTLVLPNQVVPFPSHGKELHYEAEIVVLIRKRGRPKNIEEARQYVGGLTVGFDLTLRDVQTRLKNKGLPWELAKSFDCSSPMGDILPFSSSTNTSIDLKNIEFTCLVNDKIRQQGDTKNMIFSIEMLIVELAKFWELRSGDLIYTGTPAGVGPLRAGDIITVESEPIGSFSWRID